MSGRALGFAVAFCIPVVLVRIFTQTEFGTYKQLFLIYSTLYGVAQVGMAESLYYFLPLASREGGRYILNSMLALVAAGLACLAVLGTTGASISRWLSNSELSRYIPVIGVYLLLMLTSSVLEIVMVSRKQYLWASWAYALSDLLRATLYIVPAVLLQGLGWLLLGAVAFASLRLCAVLVYAGREFKGDLRPDPELLKRQLAYAVPFEMAVLAETLQANFHQYAVSYHFDAATFAIYSVGCLQIPLVEFLGISAANVMMVRMAEDIRDGRRQVVVALWHDTTRKLALVFFPLVGLLLVNAREIIALLFTANYLASVPIFMVWSTAILLGPLMTDAVLRVYAQTRFLFVINTVRLLLVAGLINGFLSAFGLVGAVLVTLLATMVGKGLGLTRMRRLMGIEFSRLLPWRSLGAIFGLATLAALPPVIVHSALQMPTLVLLVTTSFVYTASYAALVYEFELLTEGERLALRGWLRRWIAGVAPGREVEQSGRVTQEIRVGGR